MNPRDSKALISPRCLSAKEPQGLQTSNHLSRWGEGGAFPGRPPHQANLELTELVPRGQASSLSLCRERSSFKNTFLNIDF